MGSYNWHSRSAVWHHLQKDAPGSTACTANIPGPEKDGTCTCIGHEQYDGCMTKRGV